MTEHAEPKGIEPDQSLYATNMRVFKHEAETPMRGHTATCCLAARLGADPDDVAARLGDASW